MSSSTKLVRTMTRVSGRCGADAADGLDAVDARHDEVDERDVGLQARDRLHRLLAVGGLPHDVDVVLQGEEAPQPLAHDRVVVGDEDADHRGTSRTMVVPAPGCDSMLSVPPSARARSSIEVRPSRRERSPGSSGSKPTPSSATATLRCPSSARSRTSTRLAPAWRRAFCSASWAMRRTSPALAARLGVAFDAQRDRVAVHALQHVDVLAQRRRQALALGRRRAQLEDQRAQLVHRLARELLQAAQLRLGCLGVAVDDGRRRLGGQREPEQLLRHRVVQLARQPVALLDDAQLAAALVEVGLLDGERRVHREHLDELLVGLVEVLGADLVGQIERAHDPAGGDDRHPEERAHLRVRRGPPAAKARIAAHVARAVGHGRARASPPAARGCAAAAPWRR